MNEIQKYSDQYSDSRFWNKIKRKALKAGKVLIEK